MVSKLNHIDKIELRIELLKKYLKRLKKFSGVKADTFEKDEDIAAIAERRLQLAIEACIDIAELIIVDQSFDNPGSYRETIEILGKEEVLDNKFAEKFADAISFRNLLVHDYAVIDYQKIAEYLNKNLGDFDRFIKEIVKYIGK